MFVDINVYHPQIQRMAVVRLLFELLSSGTAYCVLHACLSAMNHHVSVGCTPASGPQHMDRCLYLAEHTRHKLPCMGATGLCARLYPTLMEHSIQLL